MKWKLLLSTAAAVVIGASALWADGGTYPIKKRDGTTIGLEIAADDTLLVQGTMIMNGAFSIPGRLEMSSLDTTITSTSTSKIIAVNMYSPDQMGWYRGTPARLQSSLPAFRSAEQNNSMWRDEAIQLPDYWIGTVTDGGDSVEVWDLVTATKKFYAIRKASGLWGDYALRDMTFQDGRLYLAGTSVHMLDFWRDSAEKWAVNGYSLLRADLSSRNGTVDYTQLDSTVALTSDTCYAVDVMRSPYIGSRGQDAYGRQLPYWVVGGYNGVVAAQYNSMGDMSLYDENGTSPILAAITTPYGIWNGVNISNNRVEWLRSHFGITADSWGATQSFRYSDSPANLTQTAYVRGLATIDGVSMFGAGYPKAYVASTDHLLIVDVNPAGQASLAQKIITNTYVSPTMAGAVTVAFSPASSAQIIGSFSTAGTAGAYTVTSDGPLSHAWTFDGSTNMVRIEDHDDLTLASGFSAYGWIKVDNLSGNGMILSKYVSGSDAEYQVFLGSTERLYATVWDQSESARIGRYYDKALPQTAWTHWATTYDGGTTSAAIKIYVNGQRLDDTDYNSGSGFAAMENLTADLVIGSTNSVGSFFDGYMTPPVITTTILTESEIRSMYEAERKYINSPTPDTLYAGGDVDYIARDARGQRIVHGDENHVAIRDAGGALLDTLRCTSCGNLASAAFMPWPWADSLSVAFGGSGGIRYRGTDPRFVDLGNTSWGNNEAFVITNEALVDSAGTGHFWTWQDAINAVTNSGIKVIRSIRSALYKDPITAITVDGLKLYGAGSTISNQNTTTSPAVTVTAADSVLFDGFKFYTAPGAAGGNQDAFSVTAGSDAGVLRDCTVLDADDDALAIGAGQYWTLDNVHVRDCDDDALELGNYGRVFGGVFSSPSAAFSAGPTPTGKSSTVVGATFTGAASPVIIAASADSVRILGSKVGGQIGVAAGATKVVIANTQTVGGVVDNGTGTIEDNNQ